MCCRVGTSWWRIEETWINAFDFSQNYLTLLHQNRICIEIYVNKYLFQRSINDNFNLICNLYELHFFLNIIIK